MHHKEDAFGAAWAKEKTDVELGRIRILSFRLYGSSVPYP